MRREENFFRNGEKMSASFYKEMLLLFLFFCLVFLTISCGKKEEKKSDIFFEICKETEMPDELSHLIEKKKEDTFHFSYENSAYLYLAVGYGVQPKGEYVVAVRQLYETENGIYADMILVSLNHAASYPVGEPSVYPYVVIRCKKTDKNVFFM